MTREKEISKVASEYTENYGYFNVDLDDVEIGFMDGAEWADEHPINPWHSIADGDLPQVDKRCLLSFQGGFYIGFRCASNSIFLEDEDSLFLDIYDIDYWMEIPKLPTD